MWKMRNAHCRTKSLKNVKNEKCTLQDLEYGDKPGKRKKMRNSQGRAFNMARNTKKGGK